MYDQEDSCGNDRILISSTSLHVDLYLQVYLQLLNMVVIASVGNVVLRNNHWCGSHVMINSQCAY